MDSLTTIVYALAIGAAAGFRPNVMYLPEAEKECMTRYEALKALIGESYGGVEADLLDIGPASKERQQLLTEQLRTAGADQNSELVEMARTLLRRCYEEEPESLTAIGLGPAELEQHLYYGQ